MSAASPAGVGVGRGFMSAVGWAEVRPRQGPEAAVPAAGPGDKERGGRPRRQRLALRHPAARASDSLQNHRSPFAVLIRVGS